MFSSETDSGIIACQAVIQASSEIVIKELAQARILQLIHPSIDCVSVTPATIKNKQPEHPDFSSDAVLVEIKTPNSSSSVINNYLRWKNSLCLRRQWKSIKDSASWLFIAPEMRLHAKLFGTWQCFVAQDIPDEAKGSSSNICLLCLFASPCDNDSLPLLKQNISSQVMYFREHIDSLYLKKIFRKDAIKQQSNSIHKAKENAATTVPTKDEKLTQKQSPKLNFAGKEEQGFVEMPAEINRVPKTQSSKDEQTPMKDNQIVNEKINAYKDVITQALELLVQIYEANENHDGWSYIGNRNDVEVYRMQGDASCPSDCFKGTSQARVPVSYALQYCMNLEYKKEWDDVFNEGHVIEDLDEVTKVTYMEYKPVWPTTARDFCSIVATRHVKGNMYAMAAKAITHPSCPPRKGKQRAEIIAGGFVIEGITEDPPLCKVTYITRADLKGKIPAGLVNKVNEKQPMYAGVVRDKLEERYMYQDPPSEGDVKILAARKYPSVIENSSPSGADAETSGDDKSKIDSQAEIKSPESEVQIRELTGDEVNELIPENDAQWDSMSETSVTSYDQNEDSESEWQGDAKPICEQSIELPRDALGNIDHTVLGNQAAAKLLEEILLASDVNSKSKPPENSDVLETWTYQGTMRNIVVLRKIHRDSSFYSFLGRGVIEVLPVTVWEAVKNPSTRFVYDNMLKKTKVVKEISDTVKIIHMRHETTACFVKQARDFVILIKERMDNQKYIVAGLSVDIPECPLERNCIRGKVLASGWTIEPVLIKGKLCSLVTYLSQVDFGGKLPIRLINLIAKRQPMSIAYLRTYLESAEVKS